MLKQKRKTGNPILEIQVQEIQVLEIQTRKYSLKIPAQKFKLEQ